MQMDMKTVAADLEPYLEQLLRLPFVRGARVAELEPRRPERHLDAVVAIQTPAGEKLLPVEHKRSFLVRGIAEHLVSLAGSIPGLIVLTPGVGRAIGDLFSQSGVNFIDLAGNCSLRIGEQYYARLQGNRRPPVHPAERGMRAPAHRVLFALLVQPELVGAPDRELAAAAGRASPQTANYLRKRLVISGHVLASRSSHQWAPEGRRQATELWLAGFATTLFPNLSIGRFRASVHDVGQVEAMLESGLKDGASWRWGGGAAAHRLTGYYRGDQTLLYFADPPPSPARQLRLVPDAGGDVRLARSPGPLAFSGPNRATVHPLLVYADLIGEGHERARDAAAEVRRRFLPDLERDVESAR